MREKLFTVTIKDCEQQVFRAGGKGGSHQNKTSSGVRIIHHPSGARGESREERSQLQNKRKAFGRMGRSKEFQQWAERKAAGIEGDVAELMRPEHLVVEYGPFK